MQKELFKEGLSLLNQPILPITSMVQFFIMTGEFTSVDEIIGELPDSIETGTCVYHDPETLLQPYVDQLDFLLAVKNGAGLPCKIVDEQGKEVDSFTGAAAIADQEIISRELEKINSLLCAPCGCTLCCIGPDGNMEQEFFEIPLHTSELELFPVMQIDTLQSKQALPMDEPPLLEEGIPFYQREQSAMVHWKKGWSLILPEGSRCPNLETSGWCSVYKDRPAVCRMPQIFPYILEDAGHETKQNIKIIRRKLLAINDCPYVKQFKDEIAQYAAACELELILKQNKQ